MPHGKLNGRARPFVIAVAAPLPCERMISGYCPAMRPWCWSATMEKLIRRIDLKNAPADELPGILRREWLVTNGLGGYASGTISGSVTWRYHGLLIAALPEPFGRTVML